MVTITDHESKFATYVAQKICYTNENISVAKSQRRHIGSFSLVTVHIALSFTSGGEGGLYYALALIPPIIELSSLKILS